MSCSGSHGCEATKSQGAGVAFRGREGLNDVRAFVFATDWKAGPGLDASGRPFEFCLRLKAKHQHQEEWDNGTNKPNQ